MIWSGSSAAFTAETHNTGNNWETGSVALTDSDAGGAMFAVGNLTPGDSGSKCIVVTATSDVTGIVRTYLETMTPGGLQDHILVGVEAGTGGTFSDCTGFTATSSEPSMSLSTMSSSHGSYATGLLPWSKGTGAQSKTYKLSWAFDTTGLDEAAVNALQSTDVGATFEWELQND